MARGATARGAASASAPQDDDVTQGPDNPAAAASATGPDDDEDMDLDLDDEDDEEEDGADTDPQTTIAQLQAQLDAANERGRRAAAAAAAVRKKANLKTPRGRTPAAKAAATATAATTQATPAEDPLAGLTPELRAEVLAARKSAQDAEAKLQEREEAIRQRDLTYAVESALIAAGMKLPPAEDKDARRLALKKAYRLMDLDSIEIDEDGDIVGIDEEIELLQDLMPNLFGSDEEVLAREHAAAGQANGTTAANGTAPRTRINVGAGGRRPAAATPKEKTYANTAEYLVSPEYRKVLRAR
jgi:hypothetical protein